MTKDILRDTFRNLLNKQAVLDANVVLDFACLNKIDLPAMLFKEPFILAQTFDKELDKSTQKHAEKYYARGGISTAEGYKTFMELRNRLRQLSEYDCLMISLALERGILCCTNDGSARKVCKEYGITVAGSLGILCGCYENKILTYKNFSQIINTYINDPYSRLPRELVNDIRKCYDLKLYKNVIDIG